MFLKGFIVALVTPFNEEGSVDLSAFGKYVNRLSSVEGISGVVVCGSTGESLSLSDDEKLALVKCAYESAENKAAVIGGIIESSTERGVQLMRSFEKYVDGFLCICPYYIKPSQKQLVSHFKTYNDNTDKDIILYNNPGRTGVDLQFDAFRELVQLKNISGIKECSADLSRFVLWKQALGNKKFSYLSGNDDAAGAAFAMGADGVISVTANVMPEQCARFYRSWEERNYEEFAKNRNELEEITKMMFAEPSPAPAKYVLAKMGLMKNILRAPLTPITQELSEQLDLAIKYNVIRK